MGKQTWASNDGKTRNQIDHLLIDARHVSNITEVKTVRCLDADNDHFLVAATFRTRTSRQKKRR